MTDAVDVARAALCEVGRPDIAERVRANRSGWPSVKHGDDDHDVIVRAFLLAHLSAGHHARASIDMWGDKGIYCVECHGEGTTHTH